MKTIAQKREIRKKQTAEVFTPPNLVNQMLSRLPKETWRKGKTFLDPACGDGNFLVQVLMRKLMRGHNPLKALQSVYGVDIMRDNIQECRLRLLKCIEVYEEINEQHIEAVFRNIVWINKNRYPGGSLDYDFSFSGEVKKQNVQRWMEWINNGKLNTIELPIEEEIMPPEQEMLDFSDPQENTTVTPTTDLLYATAT